MSAAKLLRKTLVFVFSLLGVVLAIGLSGLSLAEDSYYPRVLKIAQTAPPPEREQLLRMWAETVGPNEGFISIWGLHEILNELGYCTNLWALGMCKPLPDGDEAQGIAKDELNSLCHQYRKPLGPNLSLDADVD